MKIGIDLGGTKIEGIALSDVGDELFRQRVPTPQGDYPGILQAIAELIAQPVPRGVGCRAVLVIIRSNTSGDHSILDRSADV